MEARLAYLEKSLEDQRNDSREPREARGARILTKLCSCKPSRHSRWSPSSLRSWSPGNEDNQSKGASMFSLQLRSLLSFGWSPLERQSNDGSDEAIEESALAWPSQRLKDCTPAAAASSFAGHLYRHAVRLIIVAAASRCDDVMMPIAALEVPNVGDGRETAAHSA